ncbi:DUF5719 family protein [Luteococcus peritonei]|uniref:DUF5719 family protein n=1 Tax=Luteococcus peritonei TaxID=88874 RepID=A0ABW4RWR3_9ACTN
MRRAATVAALAIGGLAAASLGLYQAPRVPAPDPGGTMVSRTLACPSAPRRTSDALLVTAKGGATSSAAAPAQASALPAGDPQPAGGVQASAGAIRWWGECQAPAQEQLVLLPDSQGTSLLLANPGDDDARVDITLLATEGRVQAVGTSGITVPAHGQRVVPLSVQVPQQTPFAARVVASQGRVSAWGVMEGETGRDYAGSTEAGRNGVLGALPAAERSLVLLANPGEQRATARLVMYTAHGPVVPSGAERVVLEAGTSQMVDISAAQAGEQVSLGFSSDQDVAMAAVAQQGKDLAAGAAHPTATAGQLVSPGAGTLLLSNPAEQATTVTLAGGIERSVQLPGGSSVPVALPNQPVLVRWSAEGPVQAAASWTQGGLAMGGSQGVGAVRQREPLQVEPGLR